MSEIKIIEAKPKQKLFKRVCAYARVSTEKDAMHHSFAAQVSYYSDLIQSHEGWVYQGVYSDEAVTGTIEGRHGLLSMMEDCRNRLIDLILVKSISRLCRNTRLFLKIIRELKSLDIDVYFEEERIYLLSAEGEMLLTIYASYAQEESRSVSENIKWRIKKNYENGIPWTVNRCYGYKVENKKLVVVPEEAKVVKYIFDLCLSGYGRVRIANRLNEEGYRTLTGKQWRYTAVGEMLKNRNYTGDLFLQKSYVVDHITKREKKNNGEKPSYIVEDDHEAIVSKEDFERVQELIKERDNNKPHEIKHYPFTSMVKCGICGGRYQHKTSPYKEYWQCRTYEFQGKAKCNSHKVPQVRLYEATNAVLNMPEFDETRFKKEIDFIEVFNEHRLLFHFKDGRKPVEYIWTPESRKWTDEMKERNRRKLNG